MEEAVHPAGADVLELAQSFQATKAGRTELATALQNRLDFRTAKLEVLKKRTVELGKLMGKAEAASRREWMEQDGNAVEVDV